MERIPICAAAWLLAAPVLAQPMPGNSNAGGDGIAEQQREMTRRGEPYVPHQNRESRRGDALGEMEGVQGWLRQAQGAVRAGQLGQANEFLERAATRLLSRSTEPTMAGEPMRDARLGYISDARGALFRRDRREAGRLIDMALQAS